MIHLSSDIIWLDLTWLDLTSPNFTWTNLTWLDLSWPDSTLPKLTSPDHNCLHWTCLDLTWPHYSLILCCSMHLTSPFPSHNKAGVTKWILSMFLFIIEFKYSGLVLLKCVHIPWFFLIFSLHDYWNSVHSFFFFPPCNFCINFVLYFSYFWYFFKGCWSFDIIELIFLMRHFHFFDTILIVDVFMHVFCCIFTFFSAHTLNK